MLLLLFTLSNTSRYYNLCPESALILSMSAHGLTDMCIDRLVCIEYKIQKYIYLALSPLPFLVSLRGIYVSDHSVDCYNEDP